MTTRTQGRADYAERQAAREERLDERARKARKNAGEMQDRAGSLLPSCGSPILIGHHSEGRHRNAVSKHNNLMHKAIDEGKKAEHLSNRAAGVGTAGISANDPKAIDQLVAKVAYLTKERDAAKRANSLARSKAFKKLPDEEKAQKMAKLMGWRIEVARESLKPAWTGDTSPVAPYEVVSLTTRIRQAKKRIEEMREELAMPAVDEKVMFRNSAGKLVDVHAFTEFDNNLICLVFSDADGDPAKLGRDKAGAHTYNPAKYSWDWFCGKGGKGFNWSHTIKRAQRQLNKGGRNQVQWILDDIRADFPKLNA